jgi:hypothetical protein
MEKLRGRKIITNTNLTKDKNVEERLTRDKDR